MAIRDFTDTEGRPWRVWETRPSAGATLRAEFRDGWLTFEHGSTEPDARRRRLAPVPDGWHALPDDELRRLCREAIPERARRRAS